MENYKFTVYPIETSEGIEWGVSFPDIPEVVGGGFTPQEAISEAQTNLAIYLEYLKQQGEPIPYPKSNDLDNYSGKFLVRMAKSLHRKLDEISKQEGISLNALVTGLLCEAVGAREMRNVYTKEVKEFLNKPVTPNHYLFENNLHKAKKQASSVQSNEISYGNDKGNK